MILSGTGRIREGVLPAGMKACPGRGVGRVTVTSPVMIRLAFVGERVSGGRVTVPVGGLVVSAGGALVPVTGVGKVGVVLSIGNSVGSVGSFSCDPGVTSTSPSCCSVSLPLPTRRS